MIYFFLKQKNEKFLSLLIIDILSTKIPWWYSGKAL